MNTPEFRDNVDHSLAAKIAWEALRMDDEAAKLYSQSMQEEYDHIRKPLLAINENVVRKVDKLIAKASHYEDGRKYAPWKVIADWDLNFPVGNAVKYIARYNRKGTPEEDLRKAIRYLEMELENRATNVR